MSATCCRGSKHLRWSYIRGTDGGVPFEQGQELAAGIPGARFAVLDTTNHILPATDPAWSALRPD